jgi:hypothetical protein
VRYNLTDTHSNCRLCRWAYARQYGVGWNHTTQDLQPLVAGTRQVCLNTSTTAIPTGMDYLIRHPFEESWVSSSGRAVSVEVAQSSGGGGGGGGGDPVASSCRLTNDNRSILVDHGRLRRTVRYQDGVVDLLVEHFHNISSTSTDETTILQLQTMVQSADLQAVSDGAWRLQDTRVRITILTLPTSVKASSGDGTTALGRIHVNMDALPLRLRVIVEDVDTFHQGADQVENFFGKFLTADFRNPVELFVEDK